MMVGMVHDVQSIALRQLETALRLYFEGEDYYSVITLAAAAEEILGQLLICSGSENSLNSLKKATGAIHEVLYNQNPRDSETSKLANAARNAMKHWPPDKPKVFEFDARGEAKDMLNRAIDNYYGLTESLSSLMQRFQDETVTSNAQVRPGCQ